MLKSSSRAARLARMLSPRHIAFVGGGSVEPAIAYTRALGFSGRMSAIHPSRESVGGLACVQSAAELPDPPDTAFVLVPGAAAVDAVRDLADAGAGAAVVASSGFAEIDRADVQDALVAAAGDMPVLGPNSPGFANFIDGVSAMLDNMGMPSGKRGVAVVSNGGAFMTDMACSDRSLPLALMVGLGNQAAVSMADVIDVVLDDDRVTAVCLYFESLYDVARLSEAAEKARRTSIPVVVLKAGRTSAGIRAAETHTAALANDATVASALFRRFGFIEVETMSEAMETLKMLSIAKRPAGRRIGFATSSGTYAAIGADLTVQAGLELPELNAEKKSELQPLMEAFVQPNNPIDLATAQFWPNADQRRLFDAFLDSGFDVALQCMSFPAENTWEDESWYRSSAIFAEAAASANLPAVFVSTIHEGLPKRARDMLIGHGVAPLQGFDDAFKAIAHAVAYGEDADRDPAAMRLPELAAMDGEPVAIDEFEAKRMLAEAGVPVANGVLWTNGDPPDDVSFPVVLKLCDACVTHKSEIGGVRLGLTSPVDLIAARRDMAEAAAARGLPSERFLVETMVDGGVGELLVGVRHAPNIGHALTLASGGVATELLADAKTLLLPATRDDIAAALRGLKLFPLLDGWRGRTRADVDAAIDAIAAVCAFADANRDTLFDLEINPLILRPAGHGVAAADAVIRTTGKETT